MKESTTSSAEMSISTPRARVSATRVVRSSCRVVARRSCMSTWIVTSRQSPILRIGIRSMGAPSANGFDLEAIAREGDGEGVGQRGLGDDVLKVDAEVHDGLRDLWADAADDAFGAHESRGGDGLEEVLRHQGIHRGHTGDVDDGDGGAGLDDLGEQVLHDDLRAVSYTHLTLPTSDLV